MADSSIPDDLGLTPPAFVGPIAPPPTTQSFLPHPNLAQKLAPLGVMLASLIGGKGMTGAASGFSQGQRISDQQDLQKAEISQHDAMQQQAFQQHQMERQQAEEQRRQQQLMGAMQTIKQRVGGIKDKGQYDQEMDAYSSMLQQAGYRITPNQLRVAAPYIAPNAKQIAGEAVAAWLKNPANDAVLKKDPSVVSRAMLRIDLNGDGIPENVPLLKAGEIGGIQFATDEQGRYLPLKSDDPKIGSAFQEAYKNGLARFVAENRREPDPKEKDKIYQKAVTEASTLQRKPDAVQGMGGDVVDRASMAVIEGRMSPSQAIQMYGGRDSGSFRRAMTDRIQQLKPDFNFAQAEANYQFGKNTGTQTTVRFLDNIEKTLPVLERASDDFSRSGVRIINKGILATKSQFGSTEVAKFEAARNILSDEIAKVLQGGGTGSGTSDAKMRQAQDLLASDMTPGQLKAVLGSLREMLSNRRATLTQGTFMEQAPSEIPASPADSARAKLSKR